MNVNKPKLILTLIVLSYTAICSLYIHSYLTRTTHQFLYYTQ